MSLGFTLIGFEADLQHLSVELVAVQRLNGHHSLVIVCHCNKTVAFTLVGRGISYDFDTLDGSEWAKQLPQHTLLSVSSDIVNKDAPT